MNIVISDIPIEEITGAPMVVMGVIMIFPAYTKGRYSAGIVCFNNHKQIKTNQRKSICQCICAKCVNRIIGNKKNHVGPGQRKYKFCKTVVGPDHQCFIQVINVKIIQSNLNSSNTDGSFTMAYWSSVLSPYEILPIDQENKYLRKLIYFIMK